MFPTGSIENDRKLAVCSARSASICSAIHVAVARAGPSSHVKACSHLQNMLTQGFLIDFS